MNYDETLAASYHFKGPLGAVAFVVVHGLELGGVDALTVSAVLDALRKGLKGMTDEQRDLLVQVLEARLAEARTQGSLFERVRLTGRMTAVEAHMAQAALAQQGIKAQLNHDHGPDPFPDHNADVELWVRRIDVEKAQGILAAPAPGPTEGPVKCPACGEENPANFGACWSCNGSLAAVPPADSRETPAE